MFDQYDIRPLRVLTDNGREHCGTLENHPYQLFLHMADIEHSRTCVRRPQSNGATEKPNQTIQNEFYAVTFRKKLYKSLEEIQVDLDEFMKMYNSERTNQGKRCLGRTPIETLEAAIPLCRQYVHEKLAKEEPMN